MGTAQESPPAVFPFMAPAHLIAAVSPGSWQAEGPAWVWGPLKGPSGLHPGPPAPQRAPGVLADWNSGQQLQTPKAALSEAQGLYMS